MTAVPTGHGGGHCSHLSRERAQFCYAKCVPSMPVPSAVPSFFVGRNKVGTRGKLRLTGPLFPPFNSKERIERMEKPQVTRARVGGGDGLSQRPCMTTDERAQIRAEAVRDTAFDIANWLEQKYPHSTSADLVRRYYLPKPDPAKELVEEWKSEVPVPLATRKDERLTMFATWLIDTGRLKV